MAEAHFQTLRAVFRPLTVKIVTGITTAVGAYDTFANQLEFPTLRRLFGMSGALMPWWGWLLVLQAIFVAALFEYIRRNLPVTDSEQQSSVKEDLDLNQDLACLLHFAVSNTTVLFLDKLIANAPTGPVPGPTSDPAYQEEPDTREDILNLFQSYVRSTLSALAGIDKELQARDALGACDRIAERRVEELLRRDAGLMVDAMRLRRYFSVEAQRDALVEFLKRQREEAIGKIREQRNDLISRESQRMLG